MGLLGGDHDPGPKPDLGGRFLGDGDPLCGDLPGGLFCSRENPRYYTMRSPDLAAGSALHANLGKNQPLRFRGRPG